MTESARLAHRDVESAVRIRRRIGRSMTAIVVIVLLGIIAGVVATAVGQLISRGL
jgi:hypothetical protein